MNTEGRVTKNVVMMEDMVSPSWEIMCQPLPISVSPGVETVIDQKGLAKRGAHGAISQKCLRGAGKRAGPTRVFLSPRGADEEFSIENTIGVYVDAFIQADPSTASDFKNKTVLENIGVGAMNLPEAITPDD